MSLPIEVASHGKGRRFKSITSTVNATVASNLLRSENPEGRRFKSGPRYQIYQGVTVHTVTPLFFFRTVSGQLQDGILYAARVDYGPKVFSRKQRQFSGKPSILP